LDQIGQCIGADASEQALPGAICGLKEPPAQWLSVINRLMVMANDDTGQSACQQNENGCDDDEFSGHAQPLSIIHRAIRQQVEEDSGPKLHLALPPKMWYCNGVRRSRARSLK
jgi:hypothetical protein